jgi:uncharacterized protein (DUF2384 family)
MSTEVVEKPATAGAALRGPADRRRLSASAMRLFLNAAELLGLTVEQRRAILGDVSDATYHNWRKEPARVVLTRDQLERVSLFLGILKGLRLVFADDATAFRWLRAQNSDRPFDDRSPLDVMTAGSMIDLFNVRRYLDAWRGVK